jgi:hypothetical protein
MQGDTSENNQETGPTKKNVKKTDVFKKGRKEYP